jgi:hypothetical protein
MSDSAIYRSLTSFMLRHQWIVVIAHLIPARLSPEAYNDPSAKAE